MFTLQNPNQLKEEIQKALSDRLSDILLIHPTFDKKLFSNLRWAVFSNTSPEKYLKDNKHNPKNLNGVPYQLVEDAKKFLTSNELESNLLDKKVDDAFKDTLILLDVDYEDVYVTIDTKLVLKPEINVNYDAIIALTLPHVDLLFEDLIQDSKDWKEHIALNKWLTEYMDAYTEWRYDMMESLFRSTYQIGGYGRWIQHEYENYLGQANWDIGDAGSVFIYLDQNEFKGEVDMY